MLCVALDLSAVGYLARDRLRQDWEWQPAHCGYGTTTSVLGYGLDAAGQSPTAVSVAWQVKRAALRCMHSFHFGGIALDGVVP